jgi:propanediol dehydratase large subunit
MGVRVRGAAAHSLRQGSDGVAAGLPSSTQSRKDAETTARGAADLRRRRMREHTRPATQEAIPLELLGLRALCARALAAQRPTKSAAVESSRADATILRASASLRRSFPKR